MRDGDRTAEVGTAVALEAGRLLMTRFRRPLEVSHKGEINLVTESDLAAEALIIRRLSEEFPGHGVLAEETHAEGERRPQRWIIDPLDGTTNYAHGLPVFCVSLALETDGVMEWGIVYNPCLDEIYTARRGEGAYLNGTRLCVSTAGDLGASLLATGFPYDIRSGRGTNLDYFAGFALRSLAIRRFGSAALDLCYVAAGRFDGFWELKLHPWDCAAGYLIVREAGGRVTNFRGEPGSIYEPECVASNALIHDQMLAVIREVGKSGTRPLPA